MVRVDPEIAKRHSILRIDLVRAVLVAEFRADRFQALEELTVAISLLSTMDSVAFLLLQRRQQLDHTGS